MRAYRLAVILGIVLAGGSALAAETAVEEKPAAGTVTEHGLCVAVKPTKEAFAANEPLTFEVILKNVSDKPFQLFDVTYWIYKVNAGGTWACVLKDTATGKEFKPTVTLHPELHRIAVPVTLGPGKAHDVKMDLTSALSYVPVGEKPTAQPIMPRPGPRLRGMPLPPATYKLVLTLTFIKSAARDWEMNPAPFWLGTVKAETAPFKFAAAAAEAPAGWQKLFADEDWYKNHEAPERLFTGVLNAIEQDPDMATTLQRTSLYSLDRRTIYTGAKKVDVLDKLVGKVVSIRGKVMEMELEGRVVREIWPAAVKEAREPLHPIETHEIEGAPEGEPPKQPVNPVLPHRIKAVPEPIGPPSIPDVPNPHE